MSFVPGNPPRSCDLTTMHARMRTRTPDNDVVPSDVIIFVRLRATMRRGPAYPSCAQGNGRRAGAASTGRSGLGEGGGHPDAGHWWRLAAATPAQVRSATLPALRSRTRMPRLIRGTRRPCSPSEGGRSHTSVRVGGGCDDLHKTLRRRTLVCCHFLSIQMIVVELRQHRYSLLSCIKG